MTLPVATDSKLVISTSVVSGAVQGTLTGSDLEGPVTFGSSVDPSHGTVSINADGTFTYTPTAGYTGDDSFSFTVTQDGETVTGTVNITIASDAPGSVTGTSGNDVLIGGNGVNTISGLGGDDHIAGDSGADILSGGDGNDALEGGSGADLLSGGGGDDSLNGGEGWDTIDGGDGIDEAVFSGDRADYTITTIQVGGIGVTTVIGEGHDTLTRVELLRFADGVYGTDGVQINQAPTGVTLTNTVTSTPESGGAMKVADIGITDDGLGTNDLTLGGADAGSFEIRDGAGGKELWFLGNADFEVKTSYDVTVIASDSTVGGSQPVSQGLTLGITNVNDNAPSVANAIADQSLPEDTAWNFQVPANTFSDADGGALTYSARLANGDPLPDWLSFDPATRTFSGTPPQDWNGTLNLSVIASDGSNSTTDSFVLSVTGESDAPAALALDGDTVREIAANGTVVGTLSAPGANPAGLTYTLLDDAGGRFAISGNQIVVADGLLLDYEQNGTHTVQVQVSDGLGGVFTQSFDVSLTDVAPEIITGDARGNTFLAGRGSDRMNGGTGHDHLESGGGKDRLVGSSGRDDLIGGAGKDKLLGGKGADDIWGGRGKDLLKGQGGADDFIFAKTKESGPTQSKWDSIAGFGGKDDIDLGAIDAIKGQKGNQAFDLDLDGSFSAGEIRQTESDGGVLLEMNVDGDGKAEMAIFLKGFHGNLSDGDFVL